MTRAPPFSTPGMGCAFIRENSQTSTLGPSGENTTTNGRGPDDSRCYAIIEHHMRKSAARRRLLADVMRCERRKRVTMVAMR